MALQVPGNLKLPNTLDNPKVLPSGFTLESFYQISDQSVWFLIWILKKNRFWSDLTREVLENPFTVERNYWSNGQIKLVTTYKNDIFHGTDRSWYRNGQLECEDYWIDDSVHGISCWWYNNGQLFEKTHWKDGKKDGIQRVWYTNGKLQLEYYWKDGKRFRRFHRIRKIRKK